MATDDSSGDGDGHVDGSGDGDGGVDCVIFLHTSACSLFTLLTSACSILISTVCRAHLFHADVLAAGHL